MRVVDSISGIAAGLKSPGLWIFVGGAEALFLVHIAEFLYPDYSVSESYISDLGTGPMPSSAIFAAAVILFGLMALVAVVLLHQRLRKPWFWILLALSGVGAIGVGIFDMDFAPMIHRVSAFFAFFFGNLAAIYSYKLVRPPLSHVFVILGLTGLAALALYGSRIFLGLGIGGMERMIFYPAMFWALGFGAYMFAEDRTSSALCAGTNACVRLTKES